MISQPNKDVLVQLSALEARYSRFRTSPDFARGEHFPVDMPFLELVTKQPVKNVAARLTKEALDGFLTLSVASIVDYEGSIRSLGNAWDQLSQDARELAAVDSFPRKLILLVNVSS